MNRSISLKFSNVSSALISPASSSSSFCSSSIPPLIHSVQLHPILLCRLKTVCVHGRNECFHCFHYMLCLDCISSVIINLYKRFFEAFWYAIARLHLLSNVVKNLTKLIAWATLLQSSVIYYVASMVKM